MSKKILAVASGFVHWCFLICIAPIAVISLSFFQSETKRNVAFSVLFALVIVLAACLLIFLARYLIKIHHMTKKQNDTLFILVNIGLVYVLLIVLYIGFNRFDYTWDQHTLIESTMSGEAPSYFKTFPFNLPTLAFLKVLHLISASHFILLFNFANIAFIILVNYSVYKLTAELFKDERANTVAIILSAVFLPYMGYVFNVYPDQIGMALALYAVYKFIQFINCKTKKRWLYFSVCACVLNLAIFAKSNFNIFAIGIACFAILYVFKSRNLKIFAACLCLCVFSILVSSASVGLLEKHWNVDQYSNMTPPLSMWIVVGLGNGNLDDIREHKPSPFAFGATSPGAVGVWANDVINSKAESSTEANRDNFNYIHDELLTFVKNPVYAVKFFVQKTNANWNDPSYGGYDSLGRELKPEVNKYFKSISTKGALANTVLKVAGKGHQLLIYIFALALAVCLVLRRRKNVNIILLEIIFVGGVLLSVFWETTPRVALPYVFLLIPLASYMISVSTEISILGKVYRLLLKSRFAKNAIRVKVRLTKTVKLYWWKNGESLNFGDELGPEIISNQFGLKCERVEEENIHNSELLSVGSILHILQARQDAEKIDNPIFVWGSGMIWNLTKYTSKNTFFTAVRGEVTRDLLSLDDGIPLGDPGLLASRVYNKSKSTDKIGVVPHIADMDSKFIESLKNDSRFMIIPPNRMPEFVVSDITQCKLVLSSSLHGLIISDSFNIPNYHIALSDLLDGHSGADTIQKFRDYYSAVGKKYRDADTSKVYDDVYLRSLISGYDPIANLDEIQEKIVNSFPFGKKIPAIFTINSDESVTESEGY